MLILSIFSYEVGFSVKNPLTCDTLFPCATKSQDLIAQMKQEIHITDFKDPIEPLVTTKATCEAVGKLCPGVSIGCALCGLFLPGTCGSQCIVAGAYCGVGAFACKNQKD